MAMALVPEQDGRTQGCGPDCQTVKVLLIGQFGRTELLLHDPLAHEAFGRQDGGGIVVRAASEPVLESLATGRLVADFVTSEVTVDGEPVSFTPAEYRIFCALAKQAGRLVSLDEITRALWGVERTEWGTGRTSDAVIRTYVSRMRGKLGSASPLITTRSGFGYRLEIQPVVPVPPGFVEAPSVTPWAQEWERCRDCGTTDRGHHGHGRCLRCWRRGRAAGATP